MSHFSTVGKIRGVFVMGGVLTDRTPVTIASIPNKLNRFSSATMNQLYHPQNTADFFAFLEQYKVNTFVVTNNVVSALTDDEKEQTSYDWLDTFLDSNGLKGQFLRNAALTNYGSIRRANKKPFDFYSAFILCSFMGKAKLLSQGRDILEIVDCSQKTIYCSSVYGIT